jgi:hypothetical protein
MALGLCSIGETGMGNFYTNFTLKTSDAAGVVAALKGSRSALVSPAVDGYVVVFDEASDQQDSAVIEKLGELLSQQQSCPVLAVLNHDDDILCYWLFDKGSQIDAYNSCPDYFGGGAGSDRGGDAKKLCQILGTPQAEAAVKQILDGDEYVFAAERHAALVSALRLPDWTVGCGFNYMQGGEIPDGLSIDKLVRTP